MADGQNATQPMDPWRVMSSGLQLLGKQPIDVRFNGSVIQRYRRVDKSRPSIQTKIRVTTNKVLFVT
jgi:hypothetical protein